ncbi:SymE family type I addiction module toxin [Pedobacter hartonius]|uniref:Toxin SymE, type I toxin-antitoxin system n=1 Tax=Pedobacter hartonius TaxID=425514 RepID=A0A1H3ZIM3_9SPHI|nr:SymE family type I addiction module toxin [Pedobacter hartonius]SEA23619.1 Toxin SymE, type I toxin-antitoxin system [Pedobacter hartonius]
MQLKKTKNVKLGELIRCYHNRNNESSPVLRIEGHWLEDLGFHPGETVVITYSKDKLVIRPKLSRTEYNKLLKAGQK